MSQLASVKQEALDNADLQLVIVGCGEWQPIKNYADNTGFKGPIYADPSRALYRHFGLGENLNTTPAGQEKKSYLAGMSMIGNVFSSIWVYRITPCSWAVTHGTPTERAYQESAAPWQARQHYSTWR